MTKSTSRKSKSQCVGFVYGGVMKPNTLRFFKSESEDPSDYLEEVTPHYSKSVQSKYVNCEDSDELFEKFCDAYTNERKEGTDIFNVGIAAATAKLRDVSGAKGVHNFPKSSKKKDDDKDAEDEAEGNEDQSDQEDDKKSSKKKETPKKLVKKGKKEEKEESADEQSGSEQSEEEEASEDDDDKKKSKKSASKKKSDDDDDEGPKLKRKTDKTDKKDEKEDKKEKKDTKGKSKSK